MEYLSRQRYCSPCLFRKVKIGKLPFSYFHSFHFIHLFINFKNITKMKVRDLKSLLAGVDENLEVGISYWDFTLFLKGAGVKNGMLHLEFGDTRPEAVPTPGSEVSTATTTTNINSHETEDGAPVPEDEEQPIPDSAEYTIGTLTTVSDPNGNEIKCWPISNSAGLVGYLRKKDLLQERTASEAASRNTAFRYWKLVSNHEIALLKAIRKFIADELSVSASLWTTEGTLFGEAETNVAPLVYFPEV